MSKSGEETISRYEAYQNFFETENGKIVLYDLMRKGYFLSSTMGKTQEESNRNDGMRELVLYILHQTNADIAKIHEFIKQQEDLRRDYDE